MASDLTTIPDVDFVVDNQKEHSLEYTGTDKQYTALDDNNNASYANNWIRFNSLSLLGVVPNRYFDLSESYVQIPYTVVASIIKFNAAGTAPEAINLANDPLVTFSTTDDNKRRTYVHLKNSYHAVDLVQAKIDNISIVANQQLSNLFMNEKCKTFTHDQMHIMSPQFDINFDEQIAYDYPKFLEFSNGSNQNLRNQRFLALDKLITSNNISTTDIVTNEFEGVMNTSNNRQIVYRGYVYLPLSVLHNAFSEMPLIQSLKLDLALQMNIGSMNNYTAVFKVQKNEGATTLDSYTFSPENFLATQAIGNTCPWCVPIIKNNFDIAHATGGAAAAVNDNYGIRLNAVIGNCTPLGLDATTANWHNTNVTFESSTIPCRLFVKTVYLSGSITKKLIAENELGRHKVTYNDAIIDRIDTPRTGGNQISHMISTTVSRLRRLILIPVYVGNTAASPKNHLQSCLTLTPSTTSFCPISRVNLFCSGESLFRKQLNTEMELFYQSTLSSYGREIFGSALNSHFNSGLIDYTYWSRFYRVYVFNLSSNSLDEAQDNLARTLRLEFQINGDTAKYYQFYYILEHESTFYIDTVTSFVSSNRND